jgi:POT family proton-dependent oligopeptide transporter
MKKSRRRQKELFRNYQKTIIIALFHVIQMTTNKSLSTSKHLEAFLLLLSIFTISAASYVVTPLIPIYCIESVENGGLAWSRADTLSLFGTFLALMYISPFIGGLLGDFLVGKPITALLGYGLQVSGLLMLSTFNDRQDICTALFLLALGIGFVKVSLTASIGRLFHEIRKTAYEYSYIASCLGFVTGGLLSNPIFAFFQMRGVVLIALIGIAVSCSLFLGYCRMKLRTPSFEHEEVEASPSHATASPHGPAAFLFLVCLGVPYFICSNQLATGMPVFLHQCVNRTIGSWTIPTLWFGAIASLSMALLSPWLRKTWGRFSSTLQQLEPLKFSIGAAIIAASFAITSFFASTSSQVHPASGILLLLCVHISCFIADFHVRPVLYSAATSFIPARYHTLATALVYSCVGLGGKLAGTLSSFADQIGFERVFLLCSFLGAFCAIVTFFWWKKINIPEKQGSSS